MIELGNGLSDAKHHEDALSVREGQLSIMRRLGAAEEEMLVTQSNLANTYSKIGQLEPALRMRRDVYFGWIRLRGKQDPETLIEAGNYANLLFCLNRFEEVKTLLRKTIPVARRVLGDSHDATLKMRRIYARALCSVRDATLDDVRKAVTLLEDLAPVTRRVLGGAHPMTVGIELDVQNSRTLLRGRLRARETPASSA